MLRAFHLYEPNAVSEASALLKQYGDQASIYAGGTELLLAMKQGLLDYRYLVNIKTIPGMNAIISPQNGEPLRIGAGVTHSALEGSTVVRDYCPALTSLERVLANVRVRNVGTLGGNLCFAEPHADPPPLLLVHNASVLLASDSSSRCVRLNGFFLGSFETVREPYEVMTEILIPSLPSPGASAYVKFGHLERSTAGVAVALISSADGVGIKEIRIAVGSAGARPQRVPEAEALLLGKTFEGAVALLEQAGQLAGQMTDAVSDLYGSAEYKRHLVKVLTRRAVLAAHKKLTADGGKTRDAN